MRLALAGLGLLGVAGTASAVLCLAFRALDSEPPPGRHRLHARLVPIAADDERWLGSYRLYSQSPIEFCAEGVYRESNWGVDPTPWCMTGMPPVEPLEGRWTRDGSTVRLAPNGKSGWREFQLGTLDGEHVLLGEFSLWRREP